MAVFANGQQINNVVANGQQVNNVYANGQLIWSRFNAQWTPVSGQPLETSGSLIRIHVPDNIGNWMTALSDGMFEGGTYYGNQIGFGVPNGAPNNRSGSLVVKSRGSQGSPTVFFNINSKFTGWSHISVTFAPTLTLETSGGSIRLDWNQTVQGIRLISPWIGLN